MCTLCLLRQVVCHKVFTIACEDGSAWAQRHIGHDVTSVPGGSVGNASLCRDDVCDVTDAVVIKVQVTEVGLACVDENAQQLEDGFVRLSLSQGAHCGLH